MFKFPVWANRSHSLGLKVVSRRHPRHQASAGSVTEIVSKYAERQLSMQARFIHIQQNFDLGVVTFSTPIENMLLLVRVILGLKPYDTSNLSI